MPVYLVKTPLGDRLVKATNKSVAINHVIRDTIDAESLTTDDLVVHIADGLSVETAAPEKTTTEKDKAND